MRKQRTNFAQPVQWSFDQALAVIHERRLMLVYEEDRAGNLVIGVFSGSLKLPVGLRRIIRKHSAQLLDMMRAGNVEVCCNPQLHQRRWRKARNGSQWCAICKRLDAFVRPETNDRQLSA